MIDLIIWKETAIAWLLNWAGTIIWTIIAAYLHVYATSVKNHTEEPEFPHNG